MSSGEHGGVRVEKCIVRRQGGTYSVSVMVDWSYQRKSFKTLKEARAWRDKLIASRPKRERMGRDNRNSRKAHVALTLAQIRQQIKDAPREKVFRDGREWTLVKL